MLALSRKHRGLLAAFVLLVAAPAFCSAQAVVLVLALGNPKDAALSNVIVKAASVQLNQDSAVVSKEATETQAAAAQGSSPVGVGSVSADFLLVVDYSREGQNVRVELSLRNADTAATVASYSDLVPFDLDLDVRVSDAVGKLMSMPGVQGAIHAAAEARKASMASGSGSETGTPAASQGGSATAGTNGGQSGGSTAGKSPAGGRGVETLPGAQGTGTQASAASAEKRWAFAFSGGGAPLILVGNASNYFRYGASGSLFAGARFPYSRINLEAGLTVGGAALFPAAGVSAGMVYSAMGGPQLRLSTPSSLPVGIGLLASGGAAVIIARPTGAGLAAKTDIYVSGAITARLRVFRSMVIGTELGIFVAFEERYPLIAFAPTLTLGFSP